MADITFTISDTDNFCITFSGDLELKIPINPDTKKAFQTRVEAETWAAAAIVKMGNLVAASAIKTWTPYQFMKQLPQTTQAGIVQLEAVNDTITKIALRMFDVAQNIRADDPNLIAALDHWISKGILTAEEKASILA